MIGYRGSDGKVNEGLPNTPPQEKSLSESQRDRIAGTFKELGELHGEWVNQMLSASRPTTLQKAYDNSATPQDVMVPNRPGDPRPIKPYVCVELITRTGFSPRSERRFRVTMPLSNDDPLMHIDLPDVGDCYPNCVDLVVRGLQIIKRCNSLIWEVAVLYEPCGYPVYSVTKARKEFWSRLWEVTEPILFAACMGGIARLCIGAYL